MAKIIGVKYVGKSPLKEDTVTNTGATWREGEVHNFAEVLARELLVHTDSFAEAPVSADGETYLSGKINGQVRSEIAAYVNLNSMSTEQLALYARREFGRTLQVDGKTDAQLRSEVQSMMTVATLDEIARDRQVTEDERVKVVISVTQQELEAINSGSLIVKLVPVTQASQLEKSSQIDALSQVASDAQAPKVSPKIDQPAAAEIAAMNKVELTTLVAANSIEINPAAPVAALRKQLVAALYPA